MKNILIILLLALTFNVSYGQEEESTIERKIDDLTEQISELNKTVSILKNSLKNESALTTKLIDKQQFKNEILEERIEQASDTIANQNSLFDGFGVLYAIITIVITLIGIVLPILTYQFGIKPSREALKDFENNADKKMEAFLSKSRNKQIEQAIENLKDDNQVFKKNAAMYLSSTQYQGFSDQQIFRLYTVLNSNKLDKITEATIASTIANRKNDYATEYFKKAITNSNVKFVAVKYFTNIGIEDYLDVFRELLSSSRDKALELNELLFSVVSMNKNAVKILINDKELIDLLAKEDLDRQKSTLNTFKASWQLSEKELEESYLNEKIKGLD